MLRINVEGLYKANWTEAEAAEMIQSHKLLMRKAYSDSFVLHELVHDKICSQRNTDPQVVTSYLKG